MVSVRPWCCMLKVRLVRSKKVEFLNDVKDVKGPGIQGALTAFTALSPGDSRVFTPYSLASVVIGQPFRCRPHTLSQPSIFWPKSHQSRSHFFETPSKNISSHTISPPQPPYTLESDHPQTPNRDISILTDLSLHVQFFGDLRGFLNTSTAQ